MLVAATTCTSLTGVWFSTAVVVVRISAGTNITSIGLWSIVLLSAICQHPINSLV